MYKKEKRTLEDAPGVSHDDVMSMTDAAKFLGVSVNSIDSHMNRGTLTTIIDETGRTAYGKVRRLVIRAEIEAMKDGKLAKRGKDLPANSVGVLELAA
jgi:hypothetical protein